jgi:hypothetical protein
MYAASGEADQMGKQRPSVEWYVAESEAEWAGFQAPPLPDNPPDADLTDRVQRWSQRQLWGVVAIVLIVGAGIWWWDATQDSLHEAEAEVRTTAQQQFQANSHGNQPAITSFGHQTTADWYRQYAQLQEFQPVATRVTGDQATLDQQYQFARENIVLPLTTFTHQMDDLPAAIPSTITALSLGVTLATFELQGDQAVAHLIMRTKHGTPVYRQTRFYRRSATGWKQTAPDAALWGLERSLETPYFIFHFRQNDAAAVIAVAPQIDALYTTMLRNFGLPLLPTADKLVIDVTVTQPPRYARPWFGAPQRISVASPAVYLAPVALSDADLLVQSVALPLLAQVLAQASEHHRIRTAWRPLLNGLELWQLWNLDLPLSIWHEEVVTWIDVTLPTSRPGQPLALPGRYPELCAEHKLWMPSPVQLNIPLLCLEQNREEWYWASWVSYDPPIRLAQLAAPMPLDRYGEMAKQMSQQNYPGYAIALATLIEYAVATYGRDRLPALLAALDQYDTWETLLPAVYGVSPGEFEAGWQVYLTAHYGISENRVDK